MNQYPLLPVNQGQGLPAPWAQTAVGAAPLPNVNGATAVPNIYPGHPALHGNIAAAALPLYPGEPAPGKVGANTAGFGQDPLYQDPAYWVPIQGQVPQAGGIEPLPPAAGLAINQGMALVPGPPGLGGLMNINTFAQFYADEMKDPYQ